MVNAAVVASRAAYGERPRPLAFRSTDAEREIHASFIRDVLKSDELWKRHGLSDVPSSSGEGQAA
jgi:DNA polymerase-3 subunit epsilon